MPSRLRVRSPGFGKRGLDFDRPRKGDARCRRASEVEMSREGAVSDRQSSCSTRVTRWSASQGSDRCVNGSRLPPGPGRPGADAHLPRRIDGRRSNRDRRSRSRRAFTASNSTHARSLEISPRRFPRTAGSTCDLSGALRTAPESIVGRSAGRPCSAPAPSNGSKKPPPKAESPGRSTRGASG